jgi:hypothetical protein
VVAAPCPWHKNVKEELALGSGCGAGARLRHSPDRKFSQVRAAEIAAALTECHYISA